MSERSTDISAARGRIIKRGGAHACRFATVSPPSKLTSKPTNETTAKRLRVRDLKDPITLFVVIPGLFLASACFTWTRPLAAARPHTEAHDEVAQTRFHDIGRELSNRFSSTVAGVEIPRPGKIEPVVSANTIAEATQTVPARHAPTSVEPSSQRREALEKQVYKILKKHGKPTQSGKELAAAIVSEALAQSYDPVFVAAVIKSESAFNALARSHKGAQGLMQIMPRTGAWLADRHALPRRKLTDPGHNLKLGIAYLKQLEAEYKGNRVLTLIAYNWGPGHVESASAGSRRVPGEVMQYAVKILNDYRRWTSEIGSSVG